MSFLPETYKEVPKQAGKYYKLEQGDNHFRILSSAIVGWLDWTDDGQGNRKPVRTKGEKPKPINPDKPVKHFWSFCIWDYKNSSIKIMEITQSTIQDFILGLTQDPDWKEPQGYDLVVKRAGEGLETKYTTLAKPPMPVHADILKAYKEIKIDLDQLFVNGDPFSSNTTQNTPYSPQTAPQDATEGVDKQVEQNIEEIFADEPTRE